MRMRSSLSPHTRASSDEKKAPETCAYVASAHAVQGGQPQEDSKTALAREGWRGGKQNRANQRSDRGSGESRQREEGEPNVPMSGEHTAENGGRFVTVRHPKCLRHALPPLLLRPRLLSRHNHRNSNSSSSSIDAARGEQRPRPATRSRQSNLWMRPSNNVPRDLAGVRHRRLPLRLLLRLLLQRRSPT